MVSSCLGFWLACGCGPFVKREESEEVRLVNVKFDEHGDDFEYAWLFGRANKNEYQVKRVTHNIGEMVRVNNKNIREVVLPESSEEEYQTIVVEMPRVKKEAVLVILHGFTGKVDDMMYCGHSDTSIIDLNSWPELRLVYVQAPYLFHPGLNKN